MKSTFFNTRDLLLASALALATVSCANNFDEFSLSNQNGSNSGQYYISTNGPVTSMLVNGNSLYIGGGFTTVGGNFYGNFAALETVKGLPDYNFQIQSGFSGGDVSVILVDPSQSYAYVGGTFTQYQGISVYGLAKINLSTGTLDPTFHSSVGFTTGQVLALALTNNGNLIVGGVFANYRGTAVSNIMKVSASTGAIDTIFASQGGFNNTVYALASIGSEIYVGGYYTTYGASPTNGLTRLNENDGSISATFLAHTALNGGSMVLGIAVAPDQSAIYIGGSFTGFNAAPIQNLAKVNLNGTLDTIFTQSTGPNSQVRTVLASGSSVYIGGSFNAYRGSGPFNRLAKLDAGTGAIDMTFTPMTTTDVNVQTLALVGTSLYVGGNLNFYKGAPVQHLVKVDINTGALDTVFTNPIGFSYNGAGGYVTAIGIIKNGASILVGGGFNSYRQIVSNGLAKINLDSMSVDATFQSGVGPGVQSGGQKVYSLAMDQAGYLYVAGDFLFFSGSAAGNLVRINAVNGNRDFTFAGSAGFNGKVKSIVYSNNQIFAGGAFTSYQGTAVNYLAKLDYNGTIDPTFIAAGSPNSTVEAIAPYGSSLYIGGAFTTYGGTLALRVAKVGTNGVLDTSFSGGSGTNGVVNSLLISNGQLYIGGNFTTYKGSTAEMIAKLSLAGSLDQGFTLAAGFDSTVLSMATVGSNLIVGGSFASYRNTPMWNLAKLGISTGDLDETFTSLNPGNAIPSVAGDYSKKLVFVAGQFGGISIGYFSGL